MSFALITGASRGIGRAIALELANAGYDIVGTYHSRADAAAEVRAAIEQIGRQAEFIELDTGAGQVTEDRVTELVKERGCPDVLVNNAGINKDGIFAMLGRASWETVIGTNLGGLYSVSRPVVRQMLRRRSGRIVNITSLSGVRGNPGQANYAASKAGIIGATKALALELAKRSITVNAVAPGFIETDMVADVPLDKVLPLIPMGRAGTPEEVAAVVAFLCSAGAAYITGEVISVNGGLYT